MKYKEFLNALQSKLTDDSDFGEVRIPADLTEYKGSTQIIACRKLPGQSRQWAPASSAEGRYLLDNEPSAQVLNWTPRGYVPRREQQD